MHTKSEFKRVARSDTGRPADAPSEGRSFMEQLSDDVLDRFQRLTGLTAVATPVDLPGGSRDARGLPVPPPHPACQTNGASDYCQTSWRSHLTELALRPEMHWHRCEFGRLCAMVPVLWHRRCLAVCRLAAEESN